jgi:Protein of unknown function (DUF1847)
MSDRDPVAPECASCAAVWGKSGATHCWSAEPAAAPPAPGACPTRAHAGTVADTLGAYQGTGEDARIARVAARVEGLCYVRTDGGAVHARWTRVEDTVAFARLMGWRRIGVATCIGLLDEARRLEQILRAQGLEPVSVCCKVGSPTRRRSGPARSSRPATPWRRRGS